MFLDECGAWLGLTRTYARAASDKRAVGESVKGKKEKVNLIAAITAEGLDLNAYTILEDSVNSNAFLAYIEYVLVPTLKQGQVVFMDNYSIHKNKKVRQLIEQAGCYLVYLPIYSPDFNPIEMIFAKIKALIKKLKPTSIQELTQAFATAIESVTKQDVRNCFRHCGYLLDCVNIC